MSRHRTLPNCMAMARAARAGVGRTAFGAGSAADASATASAASVHTCGKHETYPQTGGTTACLTRSLFVLTGPCKQTQLICMCHNLQQQEP